MDVFVAVCLGLVVAGGRVLVRRAAFRVVADSKKGVCL